MKKKILTLILLTVSLVMFSQSNYNEAIQQGDDAVSKGKYTTAIRKYLVARAFDESKRADVQVKLETVYSIIDDALIELEETKKELNEKKTALEKKDSVLKEKERELGDTNNKLSEVTAEKVRLDGILSELEKSKSRKKEDEKKVNPDLKECIDKLTKMTEDRDKWQTDFENLQKEKEKEKEKECLPKNKEKGKTQKPVKEPKQKKE